jgi:hypothetical protein
MFSTTTILEFFLISTLVLAVSRTLAISIAVNGAESGHRADILRGLAECMKWWKR